MNNEIALKAIQILAEEKDIDLDHVLAFIANHFSTIDTLDAVSRAAESANVDDTPDIFGFNQAQRKRIEQEVLNRGKVKGILLVRELYGNDTGATLGLVETKQYIEDNYADAVNTYIQNNPDFYSWRN